jgi:HSP90 family molecular chaperone
MKSQTMGQNNPYMFKGTKVLEINPESSIIKELDKL